MARFSLIPREEQFFADFVGLAEQIRGGSRLLKQMVAVNPPDAEKVEAIKDIEHAKKMAREFFGAGSGGPAPYTRVAMMEPLT